MTEPAKPRRRWPILVVGLLVVAALAGLVLLRRAPVPEAAPQAAPAERVMQLSPMEVTRLAPRRLERTVRITGTLQPARQAQLAAQVAGTVEAVTPRPGDRVSAGQVLAQIDVTDLEIRLAQQRATMNATSAQLALARTQLDSTRQLNQRGLAAQSALESAEANVSALAAQVAALQAQVSSAEIALGNASIRAPFPGVVATRSVEQGQTVNIGSPVMTLVDLATMEVTAVAPLSATAALAEGQTATLSIEAFPGRSFSAKVDRISPVAVEGTRSIAVYLSLDNAEGLFRGGMFATGEIVIAALDDALALPAAALREDRDGRFVLALEDGVLVRRPVEPGERWTTGNLTEILSGLAAGDVVVAAALPELAPGMRASLPPAPAAP